MKRLSKEERGLFLGHPLQGQTPAVHPGERDGECSVGESVSSSDSKRKPLRNLHPPTTPQSDLEPSSLLHNGTPNSGLDFSPSRERSFSPVIYEATVGTSPAVGASILQRFARESRLLYSPLQRATVKKNASRVALRDIEVARIATALPALHDSSSGSAGLPARRVLAQEVERLRHNLTKSEGDCSRLVAEKIQIAAERDLLWSQRERGPTSTSSLSSVCNWSVASLDTHSKSMHKHRMRRNTSPSISKTELYPLVERGGQGTQSSSSDSRALFERLQHVVVERDNLKKELSTATSIEYSLREELEKAEQDLSHAHSQQSSLKLQLQRTDALTKAAHAQVVCLRVSGCMLKGFGFRVSVQRTEV